MVKGLTVVELTLFSGKLVGIKLKIAEVNKTYETFLSDSLIWLLMLKRLSETSFLTEAEILGSVKDLKGDSLEAGTLKLLPIGFLLGSWSCNGVPKGK